MFPEGKNCGLERADARPSKLKVGVMRNLNSPRGSFLKKRPHRGIPMPDGNSALALADGGRTTANECARRNKAHGRSDQEIEARITSRRRGCEKPSGDLASQRGGDSEMYTVRHVLLSKRRNATQTRSATEQNALRWNTHGLRDDSLLAQGNEPAAADGISDNSLRECESRGGKR